jgi:hypothetical protein
MPVGITKKAVPVGVTKKARPIMVWHAKKNRLGTSLHHLRALP